MLWGIVGLVVGLAAMWVVNKIRADDALPMALAADAPPQMTTEDGKKKNVLVGMSGDVQGKRYHIGSRTLTIGRSQINHIQTTDGAASRTHCQLRGLPGGVQLNDMTSANGTVLNGEPVKNADLADGDIITIGDASFVFRLEAEVHHDAAHQPKNAGAKATAQTALSKGGQLAIIIDSAIQNADGDVEKASRKLGCDVDTLMLLLGQDISDRQ